MRRSAILLGAALVFILLGGVFYYEHLAPRSVACTAEAKICPDGSAVGRSGPNCAFAPCSAISAHHLSAGLYPLYPGLAWNAETATTTLALTGYRVSSQTVANISDLSAISSPFEKYYREKLSALGWSEDNTLAAGGPGSAVIAYRKSGGLIILSYQTVFHGGGSNEPVSCPCDISFSLFSSGSAASPDLPDPHADLIRVTSPQAYASVTSPITITGEARGTWYFEASFPVLLMDGSGKIIAQGVAEAQGDWMTTDFVPFTATLSFVRAEVTQPYASRATLILKKDNASGLPAHDDAVYLPVYLQP